jgi:hypothetical protein
MLLWPHRHVVKLGVNVDTRWVFLNILFSLYLTILECALQLFKIIAQQSLNLLLLISPFIYKLWVFVIVVLVQYLFFYTIFILLNIWEMCWMHTSCCERDPCSQSLTRHLILQLQLDTNYFSNLWMILSIPEVSLASLRANDNFCFCMSLGKMFLYILISDPIWHWWLSLPFLSP